MNPLERENKHIEKNTHKIKSSHKTLSMNWKEQILSPGSTDKTYNKSECFQPSPRMNHCSAFYKNRIYVWGGNISELDSSSSQLFLYAYQLDSNTWKRLWTKSSYNDLEALQGQCQVVINNRWYMYGGRNKAGKYPSQLWRLNLDALEWVKCQQKGELPNPTQGGQLIALQKSYLLHYQGFNSFSGISSHAISIYSIDTKTWHRCEGNYEYSLRYRIGTSICLQNNRIFMFGGAYETADGFQYLNDMHELIVNAYAKTNKILESKIVISQTPVPPRAEHFLFPIAKNYLCLIGGRNAQDFFSDIWIYNLRNQSWTQDGFCKFLSQRSIGYSCVIGAEEIFFFGGLRQDIHKTEMINALWGIQVQSKLPYIQDDTDHTEPAFSQSCYICFEKKNKFLFASKQFSSNYIKDYKNQIEFPFAAFGLLLDNCLLNGATEIILQFDLDPNGLYYIKIQDNGKLAWQESEVLPNLAAFCCQNQMILMGCDKKVKKKIIRSNQMKEYGVNLKLGCLRLGKRFLFISYNAQILRVLLFDEQSTNEQSEDKQYTLRYYAWDQSTKELINASMSNNQQYIEHEYRKYVRDVLASKVSKNVVYIFETIMDDGTQEIKCRKDLNDIYFGNNQNIKELEKKGYKMSESIDVSLKTYLSCLFLKNQNLSIHMGFGGVITVLNLPINLQVQLQQIDKLSKSGLAVELQGLVEFDFRFAEFYFLRDLRPNFRFFNNGVLLYYKNRLINRCQPALGDMVPFLLQQQTYNSQPFFGFAELPQNIPINASKTNFTFAIMLEKMYSRLKFVEESFKARHSKFLAMERLPHPKPKLDSPVDEETVKIRKYFRDMNEQQKLKKRPSERHNDETIVRRRSKKLEKADFTPPTYKMKQIDQQIRRTRLHNAVATQPAPALSVLIEHEDSSIQQIQQTNHKKSK